MFQCPCPPWIHFALAHFLLLNYRSWRQRLHSHSIAVVLPVFWGYVSANGFAVGKARNDVMSIDPSMRVLCLLYTTTLYKPVCLSVCRHRPASSRLVMPSTLPSPGELFGKVRQLKERESPGVFLGPQALTWPITIQFVGHFPANHNSICSWLIPLSFSFLSLIYYWEFVQPFLVCFLLICASVSYWAVSFVLCLLFNWIPL